MEDNTKLTFEANRDTAAVLYLSEVYNIDRDVMLLLYDRYEKDVFLFFFLFAQIKTTFPSASKLGKVLSMCESFARTLNTVDDAEFDDPILTKIAEYYTDDGEFEVEVKIDNTHSLDGEFDVRFG